MTAIAQPEENRVAPLTWPEGVKLVLENPYDFRPALDALMEKVEQIRAALPDQKPVVVFGENHGFYAHDRFQADFLKALFRRSSASSMREKVAYGYELPHNYGGAILTYDLDLTTAEGRHTLRTRQRHHFSIDRKESSNYPQARLNVTGVYGYNMGFNDVADYVPIDEDNETFYCDLSDPQTYDFIHKLYDGKVPPQKELIRDSPDNSAALREGLKISNGFMAEKIGQHFADAGADIYVQTCGAAHLVGYAPYQHSYEDSLTQALERKGYAVLPVLLPPEEAYFIPPEGLEALHKKGMIVIGLGSTTIKEVSEAEKDRYDAAHHHLFNEMEYGL